MHETGLIPFEKASYRAQVRRLRALAVVALKQYPIRVSKLNFVNHGENTTFQVVARDGAKYLLRIHRNGYHTPAGIREELSWLSHLAKAGLAVPRPFKSKSGKTLLHVSHDAVGARPVDCFHWIEGRFLSKSITEKTMFEIGELLARSQIVATKLSSRHRRYWTSDGLVGDQPKFGPVDHLAGAKPSDQKLLTKTRKALLKKISRYELKYPDRMGLIHADLHFGNLLKTEDGRIGAIDFDDSGFGFHMYDLVIPLLGVEHHLKDHKRFKLYPKMKRALLEGYASIKPLYEEDRELLQDLIIARKILMLGWLQSRSDNPRIAGRVKKYASVTARYIRKPYL